MEDKATYTIPKLTRKNYNSWMPRVKSEMLCREVYEAVSGYADAPGAVLGQEEVRKRAKANNTALAIIMRTVSDDIINDIADCDLASEAWDIIDRLCNENTEYGAMVKWRELNSMVKTPDISIQEYATKIVNANRVLNKNELGLTDKQLATLFLTGLPDEYGITVKTLVAKMDDLTFSVAKQVILEEEESLNATKSESHRALFTKKTPNKKKEGPAQSKEEGKQKEHKKPYHQNRENRVFFCYACGESGHIAAKCQKSEEERKNQETKTKKAEETKKATASVATREHIALCVRNNENVSSSQGVWILDGGASDHMTCRRDLFRTFKQMGGEVELGDGAPLMIEGIGSVLLHMSEECGGNDVELREVLYVPALKDNLISQGQIEEKGLRFDSFKGVTKILMGEKLVFQAHRVSRMYYVTTEGSISIEDITRESEKAKKKAFRVSLSTWHSRLGHPSQDSLLKTDILKELTQADFPKEDCIPCIKGKMKRSNFPVGEGEKVTKVLDRIHSDIMGPISPLSIGNRKFIVTFIDEASRYVEAVAICRKSEAYEEFLEFKEKVEVMHERKINEFQTDQGKEYDGRLNQYLQRCGIQRRKSVVYTPQQNGLSERMNLTLQNIIRCMLAESGLPMRFWAEALQTACYVRNRRSTASLDFKTPFEVWKGRPLKDNDFKHLRIFGCQAWAWIPKEQRNGKFGARARECVFLGYEEGIKGYRVWDLERKTVFSTRDVIFREHIFPVISGGADRAPLDFGVDEEVPFPMEDMPDPGEVPGDGADGDRCPDGDNNEGGAGGGRRPGGDNVGAAGAGGGRRPGGDNNGGAAGGGRRPADGGEVPVEQQPRRSERLRQPKAPCTMACCRLAQQGQLYDGETIELPVDVEEALSGPHADDWRLAMEKELGVMKSQGVWELVKRPADSNVIGCKWVFTVKRQKSKTIVFKAHLVAQGFRQKEGIDYFETTSPVVHRKSLRVLMALAVENEWEIVQLDVVGAYLNSDIDVTIFMKQPPGFESGGDRFVCKLKKSIYGLKQAGRNWNNHLHKLLMSLGFLQCVKDPCVYRKDGVIIAVYVDDLLVTGVKECVDAIRESLCQKLEMKDLGDISHFLSMVITRPSKDELKISQEFYVDEVLHEFSMTGCTPYSAPLEQSFYKDSVVESPPFDRTTYKKAIGSLTYLSVTSRPDIANAVCLVSQSCESPKVVNWTHVKHIFHYLSGTGSYKLCYKKSGEPIVTYVDADWANDRADSRSITGYAIILAGGVVSWSSKKQKTVSSSSTHAEYVAMYHCVTEVQWLSDFLIELGQGKFVGKPCVIFEDNTGAISIANSNAVTDGNKHIRTKYHYTREVVNSEQIKFCHVESDNNFADLLTKPLLGPKTKDLAKKLGVV